MWSIWAQFRQIVLMLKSWMPYKGMTWPSDDFDT